MSKGYSRRTLAQKLGIKEGQKIAFLNEPDGYDILFGELPFDVSITHEVGEELDFIQLFRKTGRAWRRTFRC